MSDHDAARIGRHVLDACIGVLLAAMALYGAVQIIETIWLVLCVCLAVVSVLGVTVWIIFSRFRRW